MGFKVSSQGERNPHYSISLSKEISPFIMFSKQYNDPHNPDNGFAAIMTCSQANENCPFIPGAEIRLPIEYNDPKEFDNTSNETLKYKERSTQIATEMFYVFSQVKNI